MKYKRNVAHVSLHDEYRWVPIMMVCDIYYYQLQVVEL